MRGHKVEMNVKLEISRMKAETALSSVKNIHLDQPLVYLKEPYLNHRGIQYIGRILYVYSIGCGGHYT